MEGLTVVGGLRLPGCPTHAEQLPVLRGLDQENQGAQGHILPADFGVTEATEIRLRPFHPKNIHLDCNAQRGTRGPVGKRKLSGRLEGGSDPRRETWCGVAAAPNDISAVAYGIKGVLYTAVSNPH